MVHDEMIKKICGILDIDTPTLDQYQKIEKVIEAEEERTNFIHLAAFGAFVAFMLFLFSSK